MTLQRIENKLRQAGLSEVYGIVLQQALAQIALTDKQFFEILSLKVIYSLKTEMTSADLSADFVLEAIKAHEEYLLYMKKNQAQVVEVVLSILGTTVEQIK